MAEMTIHNNNGGTIRSVKDGKLYTFKRPGKYVTVNGIVQPADFNPSFEESVKLAQAGNSIATHYLGATPTDDWFEVANKKGYVEGSNFPGLVGMKESTPPTVADNIKEILTTKEKIINDISEEPTSWDNPKNRAMAGAALATIAIVLTSGIGGALLLSALGAGKLGAVLGAIGGGGLGALLAKGIGTNVRKGTEAEFASEK